jgi:hypothetical protein
MCFRLNLASKFTLLAAIGQLQEFCVLLRYQGCGAALRAEVLIRALQLGRNALINPPRAYVARPWRAGAKVAAV